jgi:hypothetical protein
MFQDNLKPATDFLTTSKWDEIFLLGEGVSFQSMRISALLMSQTKFDFAVSLLLYRVLRTFDIHVLTEAV